MNNESLTHTHFLLTQLFLPLIMATLKKTINWPTSHYPSYLLLLVSIMHIWLVVHDH